MPPFSLALIWHRFVQRRLETIRNKVSKEKSLKNRRWRLLQVESSLACNLSCMMCPWKEISKDAFNHGIMSPDVWDAVRPHLKEADAVDFSGGGEPLLQPRLLEWIKEARAAGCNTGMLTNAFLLKKDIGRQLIDIGIDWIGISMDGATKEVYENIRIGSNFERVCEHVAHMAKTRNGRTPKMMINFVLLPANFRQVEEMIRLAARLGVDQVNFKHCDVIRGEHGKDLGMFAQHRTKDIRRMEKKFSKARRLAKKLQLHTTAFPFIPNEKPVCDQDPRNSMFIRHDGAVGPCINLAIGGPTTFLGRDVVMPTVHYGRLPENDLDKLWESELCCFFRDRFQSRVKTHENSLTKSVMDTASLEKAMETARRAMPKAPDGCQVCHYLYDL